MGLTVIILNAMKIDCIKCKIEQNSSTMVFKSESAGCQECQGCQVWFTVYATLCLEITSLSS